MELEILKTLREQTGAGVMDCRKALAQSNGQLNQAIAFLNQKGLAQASKKADRETHEGTICSYIHAGGKIGVLVEINCETDFVARNDLFSAFAKNIALHIAGSVPPPNYICKEEAPADAVLKETCLLEMPFIKDPSVTIKEMIAQTIAKTGENITIRRFTRYQLGG